MLPDPSLLGQAVIEPLSIYHLISVRICPPSSLLVLSGLLGIALSFLLLWLKLQGMLLRALRICRAVVHILQTHAGCLQSPSHKASTQTGHSLTSKVSLGPATARMAACTPTLEPFTCVCSMQSWNSGLRKKRKLGTRVMSGKRSKLSPTNSPE